MAEAYRKGGFDDFTGADLLGGATIYSLANWSLSKVGYVELRGGHYLLCFAAVCRLSAELRGENGN
jgi:hypothetical protein